MRGTTEGSGGGIEEIDGYRDLVRIGQGGFGAVFRAWQEGLEREVAIKVLAVPELDDATVSSFLAECRLTSQLTGHPNVVTVLDAGKTRSGRPYVTMEYFRHGSLRQRLDREGPLPVKDALRIGVKIAGALAAAHHAGILHRDIKPANILVSSYGEPALADFGVARLLGTSKPSAQPNAMTPHHAAPEILEGAPASQASDVYALGSTLYQLLAGHPAHGCEPNEDTATLVQRLRSEDPPAIGRPDVPVGVMEIVRKAMARQPQDRFADLQALATALQQLQAVLGLTVTELAASAEPVRQASRTDSAASALPLSADSSEETVKRSATARAANRTAASDPDTSSTILRPKRALNDEAASRKRRWRLALVAVLATVAVTSGGLVAWGMSAGTEPVTSTPVAASSSPSASATTPAASPGPVVAGSLPGSTAVSSPPGGSPPDTEAASPPAVAGSAASGASVPLPASSRSTLPALPPPSAQTGPPWPAEPAPQPPPDEDPGLVPAPPAPAPPAAAEPRTFTEQAYSDRAKPTFQNPFTMARSGQGPSVQPGQRIEVICRIHDPDAPASVKPGWWYRIASAPWNGQYYTVANSYLNGDPPQGPYVTEVDTNVPLC